LILIWVKLDRHEQIAHSPKELAGHFIILPF